MVNFRMRRFGAPQSPRHGMCLVRSKSELDQAIGGRTLSFNDECWCGWELARLLRNEGTVIILEYDPSLTEGEITEPAESLDVTQHPGFFCKKCLAEGRITRFPASIQLRGHATSHSEGGHGGWPKGRPKHPAKAKAYEQRKYNAQKQREHRARVKAKETEE